VLAVKWALVLFAALSVALVVLSKLLAFLRPPRPGRSRAAALRRWSEALAWAVLVPALVGLAILAVTAWLGA